MIRNGARQLIHKAVGAEFSKYLSHHQHPIDDVRVVLVRNRLPSKTRDYDRYRSSQCSHPQDSLERRRGTHFLLCIGTTPYIRKTRILEATLPWMYLKGVSTGGMEAALNVLVRHDVQDPSASTVSHLKSE